MGRVLSRFVLVLVILVGLVAGAAGRLMWQPRAAVPRTGEERRTDTVAGTAAPLAQRHGSPPPSPRGVDPDVWRLMLERPEGGAWAATLERLEAEDREDLRSLILLRWCETDAEAALAWLAGHPSRWPAAAWSWIAKHPLEGWRAALTNDSGALARVAVSSPTELAANPSALREILTSATSRQRTVIAEMARRFAINHDEARFLELAEADFDAAGELLLATDPFHVTSRSSMLDALVESDPAAAEKLLARASPKERLDLQGLLVLNLASTDLQAAERVLAEMPPGTVKDAAAMQLALARAAADPQAASSLIATLGEGSATSGAQFSALKRLAGIDPAAALAAAEQIAAAGARDPVYGDSQWAHRLAAVDWQRAFAVAVRTNGYAAESLLYSKDPAEVASRLSILRELGATDADAASRAVGILAIRNQGEILSLAGSSAENPLTAAARLWVANRPLETGPGQPQELWVSGRRVPGAGAPGTSVAQVLSEVDPSMVQPRVFADTASGWVRQEPEQASQWVATLPAGPARDAAIGGLVDGLIGEPGTFGGLFGSTPRHSVTTQSSADLIDYPSALAWAAAVSDPVAREELALKAAQHWIDADPGAATQGLQSLGLPADERHRLFVELGMRP